MFERNIFDTFDFLVCLNISFLNNYAKPSILCGQTTQYT